MCRISASKKLILNYSYVVWAVTLGSGLESQQYGVYILSLQGEACQRTATWLSPGSLLPCMSTYPLAYPIGPREPLIEVGLSPTPPAHWGRTAPNASRVLKGRGLQLPFEGTKFSKLHCDLRQAAVIIIAPHYL